MGTNISRSQKYIESLVANWTTVPLFILYGSPRDLNFKIRYKKRVPTLSFEKQNLPVTFHAMISFYPKIGKFGTFL